jgi:transcriptional regulator with XRE-family HTH domain
MDDLGKRIAAARAYAGLSPETLADSISLTAAAIHRIEAGLEKLPEEERWSVIRAVSAATDCPIAFFTTDFASLDAGVPPEQKLARLEGQVDNALRRMDEVIREAKDQMNRGKDQLDRFIEHQAPDHDLLLRIAEHLGVPAR